MDDTNSSGLEAAEVEAIGDLAKDIVSLITKKQATPLISVVSLFSVSFAIAHENGIPFDDVSKVFEAVRDTFVVKGPSDGGGDE